MRAIEGGSRRCSTEVAARIAGLFGVESERLWPSSGSVPGVLVTLEASYRDFAIQDGRRIHARYAGQQRFGKRTELDRIGSSAARRAVEQLHAIAPGGLRDHGLDAVSTRNLDTRSVYVRPEHSGRVFAVAGPLEGIEAMLEGESATLIVFGSIDAERARTRAAEGNPPAWVWSINELDPPPAPPAR